MVKKRDIKKEESNENKDIFNTWAESYTAFSKIWEDSYVKLYRPWIESSGEMFEKMTLLSKEAAPQKYREFYDEWIKTYQGTFGRYYPIPTMESSKKTFEKFLSNAEESNKLYRSWITELEENSATTRDILQGKPDPVKYKECYDMWMNYYEKIFDDLFELPSQKNTREIFGSCMGIPDIYLDSFIQMSKLWKNSCTKFYKPMNESMLKLSEKMAEISTGKADPDAYKEFYNLWMDTYKTIYDKYGASMEPSREIFEDFVTSNKIYLSMYKSWIAVLEEMSEKATEMLKQTSDPDEYKKFYDLWVKTYQKAFDSFFEDMPMAGGPIKEFMEPLKAMAKMYADTFNDISNIWLKSGGRSSSAYPGKNKRGVWTG